MQTPLHVYEARCTACSGTGWARAPSNGRRGHLGTCMVCHGLGEHWLAVRGSNWAAVDPPCSWRACGCLRFEATFCYVSHHVPMLLAAASFLPMGATNTHAQVLSGAQRPASALTTLTNT